MGALSRRSFLTVLAAAVPSLAVPRSALAESAAVRTIRFNHLHTGERLAIEYFSGGAYVPDALRAIDQVLRTSGRERCTPSTRNCWICFMA